MRPLRISLAAFGPYCEKQTLDFADLGEARLFLIHGPTGAGKTTVLDAICVALYGETSGDERTARQMRSDLADASLCTEVTFDFQLGKQVYRIYRRPEQERPKPGGGVTKVPHKAMLWRRTETEDDEDGAVLAEQVQKVNQKIGELIGFNAHEFRQVVMLPQGRFREMLAAGSGARQKIFQTLFQTGIYKRIEEALKENSKEILRKSEDLGNRESGILEQAEAGSEDDLKQRINNTNRELDRARSKVAKLSEKEEKRRQARDTAKIVQEKLDVVAGTLRKLNELEKQKLEQDKRREKFKAAEAVGQLETNYQHFTEAKKDYQKYKTLSAEADQKLKAAVGATKNAQLALGRENDRDKERSVAARKVIELEDHKKKMGGITAARKKAEAEAGTLARAIEHFNKKSDAKVSADKILKEKEKTLVSARHAEHSLDGHKAKVGSADRNLRDRKRFEELGKKEPKVKKKLETAENKVRLVDKKKEAKRMDLRAAEDAHWTAAASELAGKLEDGKPCPVCGSLDHPAPTETDAVSSAGVSLVDLRAELDDLTTNYEDANTDLAGVKREESELNTEMNTLRKTLGKSAEKPVDGFLKEFGIAKGALAEAETFAKKIPKLGKGIARARKDLEIVQEAFNAANSKREAALARDEKAKAVVSERESEIPEKLHSPEALEDALARARENEISLKKRLESSQKNFERVGKEEATAKQAKIDKNRALNESNKRLEHQDQSFQKSLRSKGFKDEMAFVSARLEKQERKELKQKIDKFDDDYSQAVIRHHQARDDAKGLKRPDLESFETNWRDARNNLDAAKTKQVQSQSLKKDTEKAIKLLKALGTELKELRERYGSEGHLAEVASGKNNRNLSFERYVLATWLDEVLQAANQRFDIMSRGRYLLQRQEEVTHGNKPAGLNLAVLDSHTDRPRDVTTLSGGEGFLAALSLALGVVDVVQRYSGGRRIDTLFIDEGFGNLDSESLDTAMQALMDLQSESGGRLIGVISHVREMQDRIDARLMVTPDRNGTRARFVVP